MEIDKVRNQFENHLDRFYPNLPIAVNSRFSDSASRDPLGDVQCEYKDKGVQLMWLMFLAGAQAQNKNTSVTLPALRDKPDSFYDAGYNQGVIDCQKHLQNSGIKVRK